VSYQCVSHLIWQNCFLEGENVERTKFAASRVLWTSLRLHSCRKPFGITARPCCSDRPIGQRNWRAFTNIDSGNSQLGKPTSEAGSCAKCEAERNAEAVEAVSGAQGGMSGGQDNAMKEMAHTPKPAGATSEMQKNPKSSAQPNAMTEMKNGQIKGGAASERSPVRQMQQQMQQQQMMGGMKSR
jgi:hypothetical protein